MNVRVLEKPLPHDERGLHEVDLVVLHATAGSTLSGAISALRAAPASYHFLIEKNGTITKGVPLSKNAWHAGSSYGPLEKAQGVSREQYPNTSANRKAGRVGKFVAGCSVNRYSIGISFVNKNDGQDPVTAHQTASGLWLVEQAKLQFPRLRWVTTHALVSPGRKTDPVGYDLVDFAARCDLQVWRYR